MTYVTGIPSKDVPKTWPLVRKFIESGLVDGTAPERLFDRIMRLECALWVAKVTETIIAACVTECVIKDNRKVCNIVSIGGIGLPEWINDLVMIEGWAASNSCLAMRIEECRMAWARILPQHGYALIYKNPITKLVVLEKAL